MRMEMARISCLMCVVIGARHVKQKPSRLRTALVPDAVGGNGGNAAADAIQEECEKQGVHTIVAACPKSIDSDILVVSSCPVQHTHHSITVSFYGTWPA